MAAHTRTFRFGMERRIDVSETRTARVRLRRDPDFAARLDIETDGLTYRYGIDARRRATYLGACESGGRVHVAEPAWTPEILAELGVEVGR